MRVVELFVGVLYPMQGQLLRQDARSKMQVILVTPAAVQINAAKGLEVGLVFADKMDWIVPLPLLPACRKKLPGFEIDRQAKAQWCLRIGVIGSGHRDFHQRMPLVV